jgi:PPP family 3-phenylpropionic acid transporter
MPYDRVMFRTLQSSGKSIISAQYFVYFGVMGIFLPYFNLYCYHLGFNGLQIGALSATRSMALIVFPLLWGSLADRYQKRRTIYIGCNLASALLWGLYLLTVDFWGMLTITVFYSIFYAPIISFLEAFSMEILVIAKTAMAGARQGIHHLIVVSWGSAKSLRSIRFESY